MGKNAKEKKNEDIDKSLDDSFMLDSSSNVPLSKSPSNPSIRLEGKLDAIMHKMKKMEKRITKLDSQFALDPLDDRKKEQSVDNPGRP